VTGWQVGDTVAGRYTIEQIHGHGGMGLVYRVRHLTWNVHLAVKSPRPELFRTPRQRELFVAEAQTWVSLGVHPHVCACHYVRVIDGIPRIFAEYLDGGSIRDLIDDGRLYRGTVTERTARILDLAIQTAWGLQYAHDQGLVHQDVKPANVLLDAAGTAKVTDFGLAKARAVTGAVGPGGQAVSVLVSGGGLTPAYASPEQSAGRPLGRGTDVWSLAVSILEMFTGGVTWRSGVVAGASLEHHLSAARADPGLFTMPDRVAGLLARCLRDDPADRPRTMDAVAGELAEVYAAVTGGPYPRSRPAVAGLRAEGLVNRALSMLDLDRPADADAAFAAALAADPRHTLALYNSSLVRWRRAELTDDAVVDALSGAEPRLLAHVHLERGDLVAAGDLLGSEVPGAKDTSTAFPGYLSRAMAVAPHPAGQYVLLGGIEGPAGGQSHPVTLWDTEADTQARRFDGHTAPISGVGLTPDLRFAMSVARDRTIRLWDLTAATAGATLTPYGSVTCAAISADGTRVAAGLADTVVQVWSAAAAVVVRRLTGLTNVVEAVAVSADGSRVVAGDRLGNMRVWDGDRCVFERDSMAEAAEVAAISPDGRIAVVGRSRGGLTVADVATGTHRTVRAHPDRVVAAAVSADGRHAATVGENGTVRIWSTADSRCLRTTAGHGDFAARRGMYAMQAGVTFTADGADVVSVAGTHRRLWTVPSGYTAPLMPCRPRSHTDLVTAAARVDALLAAAAAADTATAHTMLLEARSAAGFARDPRILAAWRALGLPHAGIRAAWPVPPLTGHRHAVSSIAAGDAHVVTGGSDSTVRVWDLATGTALHAAKAHAGSVERVVLTASATVSSGRDGRLRIAGHTTLTGHTPVEGHGADLTALVPLAPAPPGDDRVVVAGRPVVLSTRFLAAAAGERAVTCGAEQELRLWDLTDGRLLATAALDLPVGSTVGGLALHPGGRYAAVACPGVELWDLAEGRRIGRLDGHRGTVTSVAFDADGGRLISAGWDQQVRVWDLATGGCTALLAGHAGRVTAAVFAPDGRFAASAGQDQTVRLWDVRAGSCVRALDTGTERPMNVAFDSAARFVLAGTIEGLVLRWELDWDLEERPS
jgi:WD40 repeat protein